MEFVLCKMEVDLYFEANTSAHKKSSLAVIVSDRDGGHLSTESRTGTKKDNTATGKRLIGGTQYAVGVITINLLKQSYARHTSS